MEKVKQIGHDDPNRLRCGFDSQIIPR